MLYFTEYPKYNSSKFKGIMIMGKEVPHLINHYEYLEVRLIIKYDWIMRGETRKRKEKIGVINVEKLFLFIYNFIILKKEVKFLKLRTIAVLLLIV